MITSSYFIDTVLDDVRIMKHLHSQILPGTEEYRPTPAQRSTLELLRYLGAMGIGATRSIAAGSGKLFMEETEKTKDMALADFPRVMDEQALRMREAFAAIPESAFAEEVDLWGTSRMQTRSDAFVQLLLKGFAAYKMQLFLYIKASGNAKIGTSDLWQGVSAA
jgi:hypothetical protein